MSSLWIPTFAASIPRNPILAVGLPILLGSTSGFITQTSVNTWFPTLRQPPGEPPRILFPIAWTALYASMGYASHLLIRASDTSSSRDVREAAAKAVTLYWIQLGLNMAWTPLFFGLKQVELALLDIVLLTGTTVALTVSAYKADPIAGYLLTPYVAWLGYATYLNGGIWYLNNFRRRPKDDAREKIVKTINEQKGR